MMTAATGEMILRYGANSRKAIHFALEDEVINQKHDLSQTLSLSRVFYFKTA